LCCRAAIIIDAIAYGKMGGSKKVSSKGIIISVLAGVLMASFYCFVAASMSTDFNLLLALMFVCFVVGIALIIMAGN
jgi:hypothetical protein